MVSMSVRRIIGDVLKSEIKTERRRSLVKIRRKSDRQDTQSITSESRDTDISSGM